MAEKILVVVESPAKSRSIKKYLGKGFTIGHSYFCPDSDTARPNKNWYRKIIEFEIKPLLKEYWFDNLDKASEEVDNLQ